ncbi:hypothetical protein T484DRAFT_1882049 [Baffinella frigidus]|nr:hypothetical protein T484DRAFT_1882049 [Cryptophyta sp. CCMP2293]
MAGSRRAAARFWAPAVAIVLTLAGAAASGSMSPVGGQLPNSDRRPGGLGAGVRGVSASGGLDGGKPGLRAKGGGDEDLGRAELEEELEDLSEIVKGMEEFNSKASEMNEELEHLNEETNRLRTALHTALPPNPARVQENKARVEELSAMMGLQKRGAANRQPTGFVRD